jgi:phage I-like protein
MTKQISNTDQRNARTASSQKVVVLGAGNVQIAACALRVQAGDELTRLMPAGRFEAPRGALSGAGPWLLTEAHAREIIAQAALRSTDIVIDYEHQTLLSEQNGQPAPAAGWIDPRSLEWREDGLYGRVSWTAAARQAIADDQYRYLSPVFPYEKESGEVLDLLHVALTNTPAIDTAVTTLAAARMAATASTRQAAGQSPQASLEDDVKRDQLINVLALAADATDEKIEQTIAALKAGSDQAGKLRQALQLADDGDPVAAVAVLKSGSKPDMSQYVPKAVYTEAQQQLAALKAGGDQADLDRMIEEGLADGRIAGKATADWLRQQGLAACKAHLEDAPSVAALKGRQTDRLDTQKDKGAAKDGLSAEELAVCKNMGLTPEQYRQANPVEA